MSDIENIITNLRNKEIREYKIIECTTKRFSCNNTFGKKSVVIENVESILIYAKFFGSIFEFVLCGSNYNIEDLLNDHLKPSSNDSIFDTHYTLVEKVDLNCKKDFLTLDFCQQEKWVQQQFTKLTQEVCEDINFSYELNISKYILTTPIQTITQYYKSSSSILINNKSFDSFNNLKDHFFPEDITKIIEYRFKKPAYKKMNFTGAIMIKAEVVSDIINKYILCFYGDQIYANNSPIKVSDLGSNLLPKKISINCIPFAGVVFDGEGHSCAKKEIIKDGKLVNLICNIKFSQCLKIHMYGNADLKDHNKLSHQRLELDINEFLPNTPEINIVIESIYQIKYDVAKNKMFTTICYIENLNRYICNISFDVNMLFSRLISYDKNKYWCNNVYCSNAYYIEDLSTMFMVAR